MECIEHRGGVFEFVPDGVGVTRNGSRVATPTPVVNDSP